MNGIISKSDKRNTQTKPSLTNTIVLGACLFGGFAFGLNVKPERVPLLQAFNTQTISFEKIAWVADSGESDFKLQKTAENSGNSDVIFIPFELNPSDFAASKKLAIHFPKKPKESNFAKLQQVMTVLDERETELLFADFQKASTQLSSQFSGALDLDPKANVSIAMVQSSSELPLASPSEVRPIELKNESISLAINEPKAVKDESIEPSREVESQETPMVEESKPEVAPKALASVDPIVELSTPLEEKATVTINQSNATGLSQAEQKTLANALLNEQLSTTVVARKAAEPKAIPPMIAARNASSPMIAKTDAPQAATKESIPILPANNSAPMLAMKSFTRKSPVPIQNATKATDCDLSTHLFVKPNAAIMDDKGNQINPEQNTWISKNWDCTGWIRSELTDYIPTVTLQPAPNNGSTLLLDQNSLALLAIRSGVRIAKGAGTVVGVLPENYKVEFLGRSEDTQYFDSNGRKYFAILNVEPGAGVLALESQANQNSSATIFTPVFEDTVTYLDLVEPTAQNLNIKVVKSGQENDPDVAGLTVGLSTQNSIQAITQSTGQASLKSVNLVHGFPVFIDVSSKQDQKTGYTYRYELKQHDGGVFVVNQISEKTIHHWLKQLNQGLSDQSGMVVGIYNRNRLDGFKQNHFSQVEPLSAKFGLEPVSFTVLWDGKISANDPLEGDIPRFMAVQVPEGLSRIKLLDESHQSIQSVLMPISPRVIHMISE